MRLSRLLLATFLLGIVCGTFADDAEVKDIGSEIAGIFGTLSNLQNETSALFASAGQNYSSGLQNWLSTFSGSNNNAVESSDIDWSTILSGFTNGDLVSKLTKLGAASVATKLLVESGWWKDISDSLDQADGLFESLPVAEKVIGLAGNLLNGTKDALKDAFELGQQLEDRYCTKDVVIEKEIVPTSCVGHNVTLSIGNGFCIFQHDKTIRCRKPSVVLVKTPAECSLKHHEAVIVKGKECKFEKSWGETKEGYLFPHTGPVEYNLTKSVVEPGPVHDIVAGYGHLMQKISDYVSEAGSSVSDWSSSVKGWFA